MMAIVAQDWRYKEGVHFAALKAAGPHGGLCTITLGSALISRLP